MKPGSFEGYLSNKTRKLIAFIRENFEEKIRKVKY